MHEYSRGLVETWEQAEYNAAEWMTVHGFPDARVTSRGADGGIDVVAREGAAQVKFYTGKIGHYIPSSWSG